jgi:hypothetical protein
MSKLNIRKRKEKSYGVLSEKENKVLLFNRKLGNKIFTFVRDHSFTDREPESEKLKNKLRRY